MKGKKKMLGHLIRFVFFVGALGAVAAEKKDDEMPRIRGLGLNMTLNEAKTVVEKKGYKLGPDPWSAMKVQQPFIAAPGANTRVKAVKSYEFYVEGETIETERTPGLFEPVQGLDSTPQMQQVTMKDQQGYILVDEHEKVVGLSLAFAFMDAKGDPTEKVVQALEKRWGVQFSRTRVLLGDGRQDVKYTYVDKKKGVEVTFSDLMFDKFVDIMKIRGDNHPVNLD